MRIAFKLWLNFDSFPHCPGDLKPMGIPDNWPALCVEIQDEEELAYEADGWTVQTKDEYNAYLNANRSEYLNWFNS